MLSHVSLLLSFQTTLPMFRNKTFSVRRRFSDFLGLYEKLSAKHSLIGCIIPPPPQKSVVGKESCFLFDPVMVTFSTFFANGLCENWKLLILLKKSALMSVWVEFECVYGLMSCPRND